jgi:hypothetical protein
MPRIRRSPSATGAGVGSFGHCEYEGDGLARNEYRPLCAALRFWRFDRATKMVNRMFNQ